MSTKSDRIADDIRRILSEVTELRHKTEIMEMVFVVKEPDTIRAAEAYDGLRKQVIASNNERRAHVAQVVEMAVAVQRAQSVADIASRVAEWMTQVGVVQLMGVPANSRLTFDDLFELLDAGPGEVTVIEAAFADVATGAVLRRGRAEHRDVPQDTLAENGSTIR